MTAPRWMQQALAGADAHVQTAMRTIDRDLFLSAEQRAQRDADQALPTAAGQTISQPSLVAQMLSLLQVRTGMCALDVGAGSGYVAALLGHLVGPLGKVIAIERQATLLGELRPRLMRCAPRVEIRHADGLAGASDRAPFTVIHGGCGCDRLPRSLIDQLADGGRMVIPIGPIMGDQELTLVQRRGDQLQISQHGSVRFVPALPGTVAGG
jgi:protein-L-isoaspartate(D-aspartate) O-methyltransferase